MVVRAARGDAELGADQNEIVAIVQIGLLMESAAGKELHRMHDLAAGRRGGGIDMRGSERGAQRLQPETAVSLGSPALNPKLLRIVADAFEIGDDRVDRLGPGNLLPARVLVQTLLRIGPPQRSFDAIRIVEAP